MSLSSRTVGFKPGDYDKRHPLIIDPTLRFATFSGSFSNNFNNRRKFCHNGNTRFMN